MLHILLLILKILLWILLGILGLVLLIALLVLFAPIHYKARTKYDGKAFVKAKIRFLFVSLLAEFSQEDKRLTKEIRIAGIRLGKKNKNKIENEIENKTKNEEARSKAESVNESKPEDWNEEPVIKKKDIKPDEIPADDETVFDEADEFKAAPDAFASDFVMEDIDAEEETEEKTSAADKLKNAAEKARDIWIKLSPEYIMDAIDEKSDEIEKKYNRLEKKLRRYKKFWELNCTVKLKDYLKKYIPGLFKHIGPRKIKGYVHYGFGDPAKTGQITGYISLLPFVYQKNFSLRPDFYEKVIEADIDIKGHLMLGYILRIALKPYLWRTIKVAKKVAAQNK